MSNQDKNQKNRKAIYDLMVKDNYSLADFDSFNKELDSEEGRKELYDILSNDNYDVGDYESFNKKIYSPQGYTLDEMKATPMTERYSAAPEPSGEVKPIQVPSAPTLKYGEVEDKEYLTPAETTRKMMAQGVKQRQQVADMTTNVQQALDDRGVELDAQARQSSQSFIPRGTAGSVAGYDAGRMYDSEYRDYAAAKEALDNAQKLMDEAVANGKEENNKGLFNGFFKSAKRGVDDLDLNNFTFGLKDASENEALLKALDAADEGNATPSQQALLDAAALQMATQADYGSYVGRGYKAGQAAGEAVPFMIEMAINPLSKVGKGIANRVARHYIKKYLGNEVLEQAAKKGTKYALTRIAPRVAQVAGDLAGSAGMAATTGAVNVTADAFKRMQGDVLYSTAEDGTVKYDGHTEGDDAATAFAKAYANSTLQNYSEMFGGYFAPLSRAAGKGITKGLSKVGLDKINSLLNEVSASDLARVVTDFEQYANWNGTMGEFAEEITGGVLNSIFVGDQTIGEVFDKENLTQTLVDVAFLGGIMSSAKVIDYPIYKYQAQSDIKKAKIPFDKLFGSEDKAVMETAFNDSDARVAGNKLREIINSDDYTEEQKMAAANYAKTIQAYKGAKLMDDKRFADPYIPQEEKNVEEAYDKGRAAETPAEMTDANNMYEIKAAEIRDRFGLGEDADEEAINTRFNGDAFQEAMKLREDDVELSDLILDYIYAKATRDGIIDAARDRISEESAQAEAIIDYRKSKTDGMIHPATLKTKDANGNDRQVYVVSGNIVTFEDGTINTQESDNDIIIQDAVTGKPEFATAKDLLRAEQAIDPEVEKQNVSNTIADTIATEVENKMNNVLPFNVGDAYNVIGADGAEHSVQVIADNGDGSVMASIDNAEAVAMPKSEIQQLSNEYNMNRAKLANEAQKEAKQSEEMMQEAQNVEPTQEDVAEVAQPQIPTNEQGEPMYEQAPVADTWAELVALNEGNEEEAIDTANIMLQNAQKALDDANKTPKAKGSTVAEIQAAKAERKALIDEAQTKVDYWSNVVGYRDSQPQQVVTETAPVVEGQVTEKPSNYAERNAELGDYLDFRDYVMRAIATKGIKFIWKDSDTGTRGLRAHLGLSPKELGAHLWMLDNKVGVYPEVAAEQLLASYTEEIGGEPNIDTMDALSEILDVIGSYPNQAKMFQAVMERHGENADTQAQAEEDAIFRSMRAEAEQNGMTVEDYIIYQEYVLNEDLTHFEENYEQIIATFVESAFNEETLNQNNNERGRNNEDVPQGVHREGGLSDGGEAGVGVLQTERMDDGSRDSGSVEAGQGGDVQAVEQSIDDIPATEVSGRAEEVKEKTISAPAQEADISDEDIAALWIKSRDELWKPNDELGQMLHEKLYEAHPEEHQPEDRKKVVRHLIEAVEKHKDHPIAKEVLKYVKYPTDEQILFRNVYHGSGAEFDKFDHSFIGTGEGSQAFGWGTYVTEVEGIGKQYAQIHPLFYNKRLELSKLRREQIKLSENIPFLKGKALKKATQELEKIKKALTSLSNEANRYLYSVEIPDNDGTNYLEYGKPLSKKQLNDIKRALYNRLAASTYKGAEQELKEELDEVFAIEQDGKDIYGTIGSYLGSDKATSEFLNKNGYVGISYPADGGRAGDARNYVIFNEADLDITDSVRFRSAEPAPVFYSNAEYAVKAVKQEKATPEQWLKMIEKNGGLKAGEDKWLGLSDWLKSTDKKTLTKQEVLDFIKENQIQIEEVQYGDGIFSRNSKINLESELQAALENGHTIESALSRWDNEFGDNKLALYERGFFTVDEKGKIHTDEPVLNHINSTRLNYTTYGLENRREIALTVPTIESWNASDQIHFGDAGNGRAIAWVRFGETTDADGNRVLVIDEVQSKRHQEGREKGYRPSNIEQYLKDNGVEVIETGEFYEFHKNGELDKRFSKGLLHNDINRAKQMYVGGYVKSDIPSAPFEKNWAELAMKRMLRYAAENGFDKIAWTTGEQQAERYDISKSVDSIKSEDNNVEETSDGTLIVKNITIYAGGSVHNLFVDANGVVRGREYDGKKLSDIVGKPLAEKLMEQGDFELEGDGLRIGGEGMKAFYDHMIPSFMNKYGKKWGVKVGEVTMPSLEENNTMHSIDVTDAMRESVMQGQLMFRLSDKEQTKLAGWYDNIAERYNVSGNIQVAPSREVFEQTLRDNGVAEDKLAEYDKAAYIPEKDMYLINGDSIKDNIEAERAIFHEVWHKLRKDIITLSELEWLAKSIGSNRLQALNDAFWNGKYETDGAIVDELISVSIEPYIEATVDVDGKPVSAFEAYLDNHITLNEATDAAKANMTEAANEFSDVFDKIFFETKRTLIAYKNQYYGKAQNRVPKRGEQKRTQPSTKQVLEDRPVQTAGVRGDADIKATRAARAEQRQKAIISTATDLASSLGVKMTIIEDLNEINDSNPKMRKSKRGSKAWYNITTDEVVFVAPNATSVFDAMQSVWHEVVAHKGLRDVVGRERFDAFLMKVFNAADTNTRSKIVALAAKNGWDFELATEEYMADLAEEGFDKRENRDFWQKVRDFFMDMLREAKIVIGYNITDNDMRYMLWRTYQKQKSQGAMAVAEDVLMQQKLGVGNFRTRPAGTRQMTEEEQIIADAKANGTYLKAPNGNDTNLTPKQWVQVRTKAFKEWFGDWEKAARIEKLRKSKDAEITGNEIEASEDLKQYKKNAQMYGRTLQGEYTNVDTGAVISLQRGRHNGGINEVLQHNYKDAAHLQSVAAIPQIIENGIYIESQPNKDTDTNPDVKEYQMFVCGLKIGGEDYTVLAKVAVDSKGNRYYDHNLVSVEKGKLIDIANNEQSAVSSGFGTTPDTKSTTNSQRKYKELISLLQTNSSKIVDANGEPKVVYHRTPNKFTSFDVEKIGSSTDFGAFGNGFYFSPFVEQYRLYGKYKIAAFLNARNPFNLNEENVYDTKMAFGMSPEGQRGWTRTVSKEFTQWLKDNGYDAVVYKTDYNEEEDVVFNPNQIKSATDNVGTFDANNDDIRFRTAPNPADIEDGEVKGVREAFDKKVRSAWYQTKEAMYDNRQALKEYMRLATKAHGANLPNDDMKHIEAWENPYMAIMQKSSINQKEVESWEKKYYHPILNAIYKIFDVAKKRDVGALRGIFGTDSMDDILNNYLQGKHGLERNRDMAVRNALDEMTKATLITKKEAEEMLEQVNTELQNDIITPTEADARRQQIGNMLATKKFTKEQVQAQTEVWKQRKDAIRKDDTLSWAEKQRALENIATTEFSVDLAAKDYSGLGEVFPNEDGKLEQSIEDAYTAVEAFEELFDTKDLWDAIKAANNATIEKSFRSGIINKATMDSIRDMYDYYIPLRGFEAATTEDVYGYLNNEPRAFSIPVKRANGRASKAEFAIPHILQMAHSAILQGNNNLVKMKMANFAQHYPTDLIKQSNMYIEYDEVNDVWKAKYAEIPRDATPEEVDALIAEHNEKMAKAVKENPNKYRKVSGKMDVPYIIPKGMDSYHQIPYKRNGVDYVLTVNGDPRLAFIMNGELEKAAITFAGKVGEAVGGSTRFLASMYTQYNPEFMLSNAFRDGTWVLATVPVRENAKYTAKFYKNYFKLIVPGVMQNLFVRYEKGTLDMSNDTHREFANFIKNGGETGYVILKDVENTKKRVSKDIHPSLWSKTMKLIDQLGIVGRGVESSARFAAYLASREEGRSITRSAYDAKEVSVNFNRKGAGAAFNDLPTQTLIGKIAGVAAEWFIINNAFFNAGMQGLAGVCKLFNYNPFKATTAFSSAFLLGMVVASLFDDDDDYYNLSETVRRQNIIIRAGDQYVSIPLAIELRAMYGLGEMAVSYARGKEDFTGGKNLSHKIAEQVMQALPINVLEGNGGFDAIYPTLYAIINDVKVNEDWQGMPIYREDKYPTDEFNPEWQMVNNYTGRGYIAASKFWSELWGGDEGKRGELNILGYNVAEINPAVVQHIAEGMLGGPLTFFDKCVATVNIARGKKDFEWRNIPFASRIMKDGGGKAQERANNREYYNNEKRYDAMHNSEKKYEKIANDPNRSKEDREKYRLLLEELKGSPEYKQLNDFHEASLEIDKMYRDAKKEDALDKAMPDINKEKMKANAILDNK